MKRSNNEIYKEKTEEEILNTKTEDEYNSLLYGIDYRYNIELKVLLKFDVSEII